MTDGTDWALKQTYWLVVSTFNGEEVTDDELQTANDHRVSSTHMAQEAVVLFDRSWNVDRNISFCKPASKYL